MVYQVSNPTVREASQAEVNRMDGQTGQGKLQKIYTISTLGGDTEGCGERTK